MCIILGMPEINMYKGLRSRSLGQILVQAVFNVNRMRINELNVCLKLKGKSRVNALNVVNLNGFNVLLNKFL